MTGKDFNKSELSQRSLKALQDLGLQPDPNAPYSLQLAQWLLEELELGGPWARHQQSLLDQVIVMQGWKDPEKYLLDEEGSAPEETSPESLAAVLVENLYENLREALPALRP